MIYLKSLSLMFACGISGLFFAISAVGMGAHAWRRSHAQDYHKTTLEVDRFHYPERTGRTVEKHVVAHGTVEGEQVRVALKSLWQRIVRLPEGAREAALDRESRSVPIYKKNGVTAPRMVVNDRSPGFLEAEFFEQGDPRVRRAFWVTLVLTPLLFLLARGQMRSIRQWERARDAATGH